MKDCVLIDFDNTLTSRDTTRFLIFELIKLNPLKLIKACSYIILIFTTNDQNKIQIYKNLLIGYLVSGFTDEGLKQTLKKFKIRVDKLFRSFLVEKIKQYHSKNVLVLVVTASPAFAVKACLLDLPVHVLGADYKKELERYNSKNLYIPCYGEDKVTRIIEWQKKNNLELNFIESWSDSFSDYPMAILAKNRFWIGGNKLKKKMESNDPHASFIRVD